MPGHFVVYEYPHGDPHPRDIMFQLAKDATGRLPKEQSALKSGAERTLYILRALFPRQDDERFRAYFKELLGLCQYGLVGNTAQPVAAMETLKNLQQQIFDNEKGKVISGYMSAIIKSQLTWLFGGSALFVLATVALDHVMQLGLTRGHLTALAMVPGLFVGVTFSSFLRCRAITFYDLHAIDSDRFSPPLKTAFAVSVMLLVAAFLKVEMFEIKIGKSQLSAFDRDFLSAFVFGAVVGVAQEALISRIESFKQQIGRTRATQRAPAKPRTTKG